MFLAYINYYSFLYKHLTILYTINPINSLKLAI